MDDTQNQFHNDIQRKVENGYNLDYKELLIKAFQLIQNNFVIFALYTLLYMSFSYLVYVNPTTLGTLLQLTITGPISAGYFYAVRRSDVGFQLAFNDFFKGFEKFLILAVSNVIQSILIFVGLILLVAPGIYFAVSLVLLIPFILFRNMKIMAAIESTRLLVSRQFWQWTVFLLLLLFINILGALLFGIGLLFTIPVSFAAVYFAFKQLIPIHDEYEKWEI